MTERLTPEQIAAIAARGDEPWSVCPFADENAKCEAERGVLLTVAERDALVAMAQPKTCATCEHVGYSKPYSVEPYCANGTSPVYGECIYPADFGCTLWTPQREPGERK